MWARHTATWLLLGALALAAGGCGGGGSDPGKPAILEGTLIARSTPAGAQLLIDGQDTGKRTPVEIIKEVQQAGTTFTVTLRLLGYEDGVTTAKVNPNEATTVDLTLVAVRPPEIPPHTITGKVLLQAGSSTVAASNATIVATETTTNETFTGSMDTSLDRAGIYYIFAPAGTYRVTVNVPGFQQGSREVTILSGEDRHTGVDFTLQPG